MYSTVTQSTRIKCKKIIKTNFTKLKIKTKNKTTVNTVFFCVKN
jgi:hypothetical protein